MTTTDALSLTAALCGLLLVIGGQLLLLRGAISLTREPTDRGRNPALCFQFQGIKLAANSPGLALFAVGLLFLGLAIWTDHNQTISVRVSARLEGASPQEADIYAAVPLIPVTSRPDGSIEYTLSLRPEADTIWVVVVAPGYEPPTQLTYGQLQRSAPVGSERFAQLGPLQVGQPRRPIPAAPRIDEVPAPLPGTTDKSAGF